MAAIAIVLSSVAALVPSGTSAAPPAPLTIGAERILTAARPGSSQRDAAVAYTGGVFFVVWTESTDGGPASVWGARVRPDGSVIDRGGILLSPGPEDPFVSHVHPRVAGGAGRFLVVWQTDYEGTYGDIGAAMVDTGGAIRRQWELSLADNGQYTPDVAFNGEMFLAVWQDEPDPIDQDIYGARVLPSGLTLDGCSRGNCHGVDTGIPIAVGPGIQSHPRVAPAGDLFHVTWTDSQAPGASSVRIGAVAFTGNSLDQAGRPLPAPPGSQSQPAVTWNGHTALFAWTHGSAATSDIRAATVPVEDSRSWPYPGFPENTDVVLISGAAGAQTGPALARRSGHFVAVWTDARSGNPDVYASRVGVMGAVLDPEGVSVATGARLQRSPASASSGPVVLVAYTRDAIAPAYGGRDRIFLRVIR